MSQAENSRWKPFGVDSAPKCWPIRSALQAGECCNSGSGKSTMLTHIHVLLPPVLSRMVGGGGGGGVLMECGRGCMRNGFSISSAVCSTWDLVLPGVSNM